MRIILSGGGTGGHVFPAIATATVLKDKMPDANLLFVGAKGKIEMEKVPKAGFPIKGLWISGFHRQLTFRNLLFPVKLISSLVKAWWIIRQFKPDIVVGFGGFASGPILDVATRFGIPAIIQEQNSYPGVTNRLLARKVAKICVAYPEMQRWFPLEKTVLTGNPVRKDLLRGNPDRATALQYFGLEPGKPVLFVFGGSLGAKSINEAMAANVALLKQRTDVQVLWQMGSLYVEDFGACETALLPHVKAQAFIDRMDLAYALADVVVCRSGALTISELCLLGKAAIFIPSPNVAEDHQTKNAQALVDRQAAVLIKDADAKEKIMSEAMALIADEERKASLRENIRRLSRPEASESIANEIIALARAKTSK
ncbi:MAG TPA: undecaprenyldiphospho-muramoylpentapeptide beta-N-acetylglucosaminyltransferase [Saprospiraceae bacterium]|nr:undecaprenyldiphospho-muramoylpentapeptide beta-N-acetylglucosaminyltransferase [Saprospiraceae bacterium]HMQ81794.1 undecaprenyldiphospho-muramoylpentapeptide beta-N-acetylglucosaminyltransferase [Saprospiraceae bacterium]